MSNNRYLEIDSTYRNRNQWKDASEFEVLFSQSGRKDKKDANDPVSNAAPCTIWSSNVFNTTGPAATVQGTVLATNTAGIGASGDLNKVLVIEASAGNTFQQQEDYYIKATLFVTGSSTASRIIEYKYLSNTGGNDRVQFVIEGISTINAGDTIEIADPTDLTDTSNPYIFVPDGRPSNNSYADKLLYNQTRSITTGIPEYREIKDFDMTTGLLSLNTSGTSSSLSGPIVAWNATDIFSIRRESPQIGQLNNNVTSTNVASLPITFSNQKDLYRNGYIRMTSGASVNDEKRIIRYITLTGNAISGTINTIVLPSTASNINEFYNGSYIQILSGGSAGDIRNVLSYTVTGSGSNIIRTITVSTPFTAIIQPGDNFSFRSVVIEGQFSSTVASTDNFELLPFSYDNHNPFVYTGSQVSQQEMVCYEIKLLNLVLPNRTLDVGLGGRIAFYPYVYVELSNVNAAGAGLKNTIYSNNPNSTRMIFRCAIDDTPTPLLSAFINLKNTSMVQTLKFKPNDNLKFSVRLPNGQLFRLKGEEKFSPLRPNPEMQISALFSIKRL